jgi:hypothetical protein
MIDRKPLKLGANGARRLTKQCGPPSELVSAALRLLRPCLPCRSGAKSAFRSRHMGNVGLKPDLQAGGGKLVRVDCRINK